jgi:hypothetical protein
VLAVGVWSCWSVQVDDSYIVYRYAEHLAAGDGLVWNVGEDPVEGFTDFAWLLWHVPAVWAGVPLELVSKLTGAGCAALTVWLLAREPRTRLGGTAAALAYAAALPTWVHAVAGLETAPFGLVVTRAVILGVRAAHGRPVRAWELPALLLLAGLLRPEGVLAVAPALAVWLLSGRAGRAGLAWTGAAAAAGAVYMAARWSYFGYPLPNTFYVKTGVDAALSGRWLQVTCALLLPLLVLLGALLARRPARAGWMVAATVAALFVIPAATAPAMDYLSRFAWHAVPVLCLAAGLALDTVQPRRAAAAAGALTVAWMAAAGVLHTDTRSLVNYGPDLQRAHGAIGRGLAAADLPAEARTLATSDAGAIPYYSRWNAIDYIGLSDEPIAHGADRHRRVVDARPTVIVVTSPGPTPNPTSWGLDVPAATAGYQQVAAAQMRAGYWQLVYARPEWAPALRPALDQSIAASATGESDSIGYRRWLDRLGIDL